MIDIFKDEEPMLCIATIHVKYLVKSKVKPTVMTATFEKLPVVLMNGSIPTNKTMSRTLNMITKLIRTSFISGSLQVVKIDNIKTSSRLAYKFNMDKD